ncbi:Migration and invasion-inhibitory protein [Varanus komodoensis]|nr:Migration and invasion-inhibitory protein [Varanus komodoensis]
MVGRKEAGRVTFLSDPKEHVVPAGGWSIRPFLGYDWIAGLLDLDSSVSEKSEEYFSELRDFRQLNKDACVSCGNSYSDELGASPRDPEPEVDAASHECVFCYRLNKRLFATPLDPETACPICKTARAQRWPETLVEPAFVRISIPRSTLLPAYKHRIHRRKSYEPADDLALPSHCLAGWENPPRPRSPPLSSLDLRSSSGARPSGRARTPTGPCPEPGRAGASRAPDAPAAGARPGGSARGAHVGYRLACPPVAETWLQSGRGGPDGPAAGPLPCGGIRTRNPLLAAETPRAPGEEAASD